MQSQKNRQQVKIWQEKVVIPTYPVGSGNKNPMFLEKRVYQGSSGRVYPFPFVEEISDQKIEQEYTVLFLENEYLRIEVLPELGGRIQRAYDKTNGYDFVYYNPVIKPALVGLAGPWIAGGIEFNWPQHHRPSTFLPLEYSLLENEDGSKTIWVGEIDRMAGSKGMAGFTLYPDKAYLEIKGQLYNKTELPQTFLWWANPAVAVNESYQSIFPPDVHAVFDHGKRDVSKFPIATGEYYKVDYSAGVDISCYKNIPVPTSYMAYHSDYNFVGGYDFNEQAGILHVANHYISPGKKQWTWGNGDFGQRWYQNLSDQGTGEYIELMTGVFTDNQPDFSWLEPLAEKTFTQYFLPYKKLGKVKNASKDFLLNLEIKAEELKIAAYSTSVQNNLVIQLKAANKILLKEEIDLSPSQIYDKEILIDQQIEVEKYQLELRDQIGNILLAYSPEAEKLVEPPEAAQAASKPAEIKTIEELYLTGLHLEQYRHATYQPDPYYLEGLKRDPGDSRLNNAYGRLLLGRGNFSGSEKYFKRAIERLTSRNPNPYTGEPYYNLGLSYKYQHKFAQAEAAFYKAIWNDSYQASGYYQLAALAVRKNKFIDALKLCQKSLIAGYHNTRTRNLKTNLLRKLGKLKEAAELAQETLNFDPLDFGALAELYFIYQSAGKTSKTELARARFIRLLANKEYNYLELARDYAAAGCYQEAIKILNILVENKVENSVKSFTGSVSPLTYYYLGNYYLELADQKQAAIYFKKAAAIKPDYCFPNRLASIRILEKAIEFNPADARAAYYLGNLFYDKKQLEKAVQLWEKSSQLQPDFPTVYRNLALAYYNKLSQVDKAQFALEKAFELDPTDARVLFELDQLYKKLSFSIEKRFSLLTSNLEIVKTRDDLYLEYITLLNNQRQYEKALQLLKKHNFYPWEGGEGKVTAQYVFANLELAKQKIITAEYQLALNLLKSARSYPRNLGEGKLPIDKENEIDYYTGICYKKMNNNDQAEYYFKQAAKGSDELGDMMYYNDQPAHQVFFQGKALQSLGYRDQALTKFNQLYDYGEKHLKDQVEIDYFAVSLPDFLVFEADLNKNNQIHCYYLLGLGALGKNEIKKSVEFFQEIAKLDPAHQGILRQYI
ncbi:tetratricopeptide repeat protein [Halanaerobium salsuginis]|uniref:Tetratricopeptide repeat-containing protein n=1 Tax=Halanaerobium salsuginis TaxID=29563 RepID=A0A1I4HEX1_9FIRM|nr:DUF5107 domain-containing protein [Halanaerobium salsuginis]SFL40848.1 Tetratricopeptide repeat-containing protein [Halanaerobium salsuginis]